MTTSPSFAAQPGIIGTLRCSMCRRRAQVRTIVLTSLSMEGATADRAQQKPDRRLDTSLRSGAWLP
jgi:hypothetical protein